MNADELLFEIRGLGGRLEARGDRLHVDVPAGTLTPELRDRLKQNKAEILRRLETEASMRRLEAAGVCIAIWEDGAMRIVVTEDETVKAIDTGGTIYSPADMYHYINLESHERKMLHAFKKRFGRRVEWKESE